MKWLSVATLVALAAGIAIGVYLGTPAGEGLRPAAEIVEGIGRLWLNALRMTVIPLIVALLVTGVASVADAAATGRMACRAVFVFGVLLVGVTTFAMLVFPAILAACLDEDYLAWTPEGRLRATDEGRMRLDALLPALLR